MEQPVPDASAESSSAPLSSTEFLESLSDGERQKFFESSPDERAARMAKPAEAKPRKTPTAKPDAVADSSPATPVDQAASTEALPDAASEPAPPAKDTTKGLDARERQIRERQAALKAQLAETDRLERELAERQARLRAPAATQDATSDSSPTTAAAQRAFDKYATDPNAPKLEAFESYDAWAVEMMEFISDRKYEARETEARQRSIDIAKARDLETAVQTSAERVKAFAEQTPDFQTRVRPELLNLVPISALKEGDPVGPHNFIAEQMWRSDYPGELALHLSEHPDEFAALMALPDPAAIARRIGRIEAQFSDAPTRETRDPKPVPKTIPDADELPVVIGKKAPVTVSDAESALKSQDFSAYERAWRRERGLKD